MTHKSEADFADALAEWFEHVYGRSNVEREVYLSDVRWYVDLVVHADPVTFYVEVENDAESLRRGMAQALAYAAADPVTGVPVLITPKGHLDSERVRRLRESAPVVIREFDTESGGFVL